MADGTMADPAASRGAAHGGRRGMVGLIGMVVLVGMGEHMAERFLPLYLQELARASTAVLAIGLLAGMDDLLSALYSFPGGYLKSWPFRRRSMPMAWQKNRLARSAIMSHTAFFHVKEDVDSFRRRGVGLRN